MVADTSVYQQVSDLLDGKPELSSIRPAMLALASGQDRTNNLLGSTRKLLFTAIATTLTLTVSICGLILQIAGR